MSSTRASRSCTVRRHRAAAQLVPPLTHTTTKFINHDGRFLFPMASKITVNSGFTAASTLGRPPWLIVKKNKKNPKRTGEPILAHSYGGTLAHRFLLRRPLPWRRRFVRRFVPVAAPWGGVVLGMMTLVAGNNLGLPFVDPVAMRGEYRSLQSSLWPLPNTNAFGAGQALVTTRSRAYTYGPRRGGLPRRHRDGRGHRACCRCSRSRHLRGCPWPASSGLGWTRRRCSPTRETTST